MKVWITVKNINDYARTDERMNDLNRIQIFQRDHCELTK